MNQLENLFPTQNLQSYSEFILSLLLAEGLKDRGAGLASLPNPPWPEDGPVSYEGVEPRKLVQSKTSW